MFDIGVIRHRFFEISGFLCQQPHHHKHSGKCGDGKVFTITSAGPWRSKKSKEYRKKVNYYYGDYNDWCKAIGIDWISFNWVDKKSRKSTIHEELGPILPSGHPLTEAIPPEYSSYIMQQFLKKWITLEYWI